MRYLFSLLVIAWTVVSAVLCATGVWGLPLLAVILPAIIWFGLVFLITILVLIIGVTVAMKARKTFSRDTFGTFGRI